MFLGGLRGGVVECGGGVVKLEVSEICEIFADVNERGLPNLLVLE